MPKSGVDYATDTITVYRFCPFLCRYCWAWRLPLFASRIARGRYDPVREAERYLSRSGRTIVVSFASDPYPPVEEEKELTRSVLEVLSRNANNRVMILTKNPVLALRDFDVMLKGGMWLGTTIVTLDDAAAAYWEPKAPKPSQRLSALREAKDLGIKTWLSVEPIIPGLTSPEEIVEKTMGYVDFYVLGALNYAGQLRLPYKQEDLRDWYRRHVTPALKLLHEKKHGYHVKKELKPFLA